MSIKRQQIQKKQTRYFQCPACAINLVNEREKAANCKHIFNDRMERKLILRGYSYQILKQQQRICTKGYRPVEPTLKAETFRLF